MFGETKQTKWQNKSVEIEASLAKVDQNHKALLWDFLEFNSN
jgi:hypothetical protein